MLTDKHIILTNPNYITSNYIKPEFSCDCSKIFNRNIIISLSRIKDNIYNLSISFPKVN